MMRAFAIALSVTVLSLGAVAAVPSVEAAPPNIPPGSTGCGYFHYHHGNVQQGVLPTYHYHHCM
jgi:hypothetical protein